jgi:predicted site-specific integrase-resolvase
MELLTSRELCARLKISRATLHRYVLAGMPHLGYG